MCMRTGVSTDTYPAVCHHCGSRKGCGQEDVFGCLLDGVRVPLCCGICTLTNTRSQFSTKENMSFGHSRNCYLACFHYPAVQVNVHSMRPIKMAKCLYFVNTRAFFFLVRDVTRVQITFKSFLLLRMAAQKWCKCISSYKQLVLNHNFVWTLTRSTSLFYLCSR